MVKLHFAIAITRTCGSGGGSYIGKKLAELYGIDLYDRKLLRLASEDSGINEEIFAKADENTRKTLLYQVSRRVYDGSIIPPESGNFISDENLFNYQAKVLRELLNDEDYVCVGPCRRLRAAGQTQRAQSVCGCPLRSPGGTGDETAGHQPQPRHALHRPAGPLPGTVLHTTTPARSGSGRKTTISAWTAPLWGWTPAWRSSAPSSQRNTGSPCKGPRGPAASPRGDVTGRCHLGKKPPRGQGKYRSKQRKRECLVCRPSRIMTEKSAHRRN